MDAVSVMYLNRIWKVLAVSVMDAVSVMYLNRIWKVLAVSVMEIVSVIVRTLFENITKDSETVVVSDTILVNMVSLA